MQKKTFEEAVIKVTSFSVDEVIVASGEFVPVYSTESDETEIL